MKKKAIELEFISRIKRDGSGTIPVTAKDVKHMTENPFSNKELFSVHCLSLTHNTYIAIGFNSYVVKLKPSENE